MGYEPLTKVWRFLDAYFEEHGISPTRSEIAKGCFYSRMTVGHELWRLSMSGVVTFVENTPRSIRLLHRPPERDEDVIPRLRILAATLLENETAPRGSG
jgi:SOS-response transcriptional repressor LexA